MNSMLINTLLVLKCQLFFNWKIAPITPSPLAGEGRVRGDPNVHPHPLNHVRFRALSCTLRGAGLILPHRAAQALSAASKGEEIRLRIFMVRGRPPGMGD